MHVASSRIDRDAFGFSTTRAARYADASGLRAGVPDINPVVEQINAMEAVRAYEANVAAAEATKTMMAQALRLLA